MRAGATVDVLITASKGTMDDAETAGLVDTDTREDMFVNDLVIIRAEGSNTKIEAIADVANLDGKIAIGDAKTVPAGKYANQALASVGLYTGTEGDDGEYAPELADKVALADKVGTAAAYVSTGDCVAGFVYSSDIFRYDGIEEAFVCPEDSHKPSCIRVPLPRSPSTPTRPRRSSTSACPASPPRRFGLTTALSFPRSAAWRDNSIVLCFTPSLYSLGAFRA